MQGGMTIGVIARREGLAAETLRYYERLGLIAPSRRTASNYRLYNEDAARRLRFIRRAQALGFSLSEIAELLALHQNPDKDMLAVKDMAQTKMAVICRKIDDLQRMKQGLESLSEQCPGHGPTAECPILEALLKDDV